MRRWASCLKVVLLPLLTVSCAHAAPNTHPVVPISETLTIATLHGKPLELHLAQPAHAAGTPLVLYASGDGGWFGAAVDMWRQIARDGYVTMGFSARAFLKIERPRGSVMSPAQIAREYESLIEQTRRLVGISADTPVILTGWSRGAAFAVLVSSEPPLDKDVLGVVAIGLAEDEDLLVNGAEDETDDGPAPGRTRSRAFDNYAQIAMLRQRCAVIQATRDNYFPAASARQRFGSDTPRRRFYAIEATNHRFSHGTARFYEALRDSLQWVAGGTPAGADGE